MTRDYNYQVMMDNARRESVNYSEEEARRRAIKAEKKKRVRRAYRIQGALLAAVIMSTAYFTVPKVADAFTSYKNPSYEAGYQMVASETHRTADNRGFWFDYSDIAWAFEEDTDFDSYVYGVYNRIAGSGSGRTKINMDDFFFQMYNRGLTPYRTFEDYCFAHGFTKEKNGKLTIDMGKYERAARDYMKDLKEIEQKQEVVQEFRSK